MFAHPPGLGSAGRGRDRRVGYQYLLTTCLNRSALPLRIWALASWSRGDWGAPRDLSRFSARLCTLLIGVGGPDGKPPLDWVLAEPLGRLLG